MDADVIVAGGGIAGLTAAALAARGGARTVLVEQSGSVGGRARSTTLPQGHVLNIGPHALYNGGGGRAVLESLGVDIQGAIPPPRGLAQVDGKLAPLPTTGDGFARASWLGLRGRMQAAKAMGQMLRPDHKAGLADVAFGTWMDATVSDPAARALVAASMRVATYNADESMSAGAAIRQIRLAFRPGVTYLDGGWQGLVDGLGRAASAAGARVVTDAGPARPQRSAAGWTVAGRQQTCTAPTVVVAVGDPSRVSDAVGQHLAPGVRRRIQQLRPVRAAVLDLALDHLPVPAHTFVLGIDQPTYLSVHSATAEVAPARGAVVHLARYLGEGPARASAHRDELEELMDLVQPGWRDHVVKARFLPDIAVTHDVVPAAAGGLAGRVAVEQGDGLFLTGDWVGRQGLLADASILSATAAARGAVRLACDRIKV